MLYLRLTLWALFASAAANLLHQVAAEKSDLPEMKPEDIRALPSETIQDYPARLYLKKAGLVVSDEEYDFLVDLSLYQRMYAFGSARTQAEQIRAFQEDIGAQPTGELTYGQAIALFPETFGLGLPKRVFPGGYASPSVTAEYAEVTGTWEIKGEDIAYPINEAHITCLRKIGICIAYQTDVSTHERGTHGATVSGAYLLNSDSVIYAIERWSDNEVVARYDGACRYTVMRINAKSREVTQVTHNSGQTCTGSLEPLSTPRVAILRPGFETAKEYFERADEYIKKGWASRFRERYEDYLRKRRAASRRH